MNKPVKSKSTEKSRFIFESLRGTLPRSKMPSRLFSSPFILIYGFAIPIVLGTAHLMLPISNASGSTPSLITALFTAISAVTVTGLTVVETSSHWSFFGQAGRGRPVHRRT